MSKRYKRAQPRVRQQKVNPAYAGMTMFSDMPQPRSMPKNYRAYADEAYGSNDTVFKSINYIITNGAAIQPKLYTDRTMKTEIPTHPLLDKLARPNPEQDGVFYRESVMGYYLIAGNSFQYAIRDAKNGPPDELWALQPDKIQPLASPKRGIVGFDYEDFSKDKNPILPEFMAHMRSWNPKDPIFGMSVVQVAAILVDIQTALRKWNLSLLQNFGKSSGAWTTTALLSPNERAKLEERVNQKTAGYQNAGKSPVLDGALKWESSSVPPSELDWQNSDTKNAGRIANLYNIPPEIIGDTSAATYNNMKEAKAASYTEGVFPVMDKMYSIWNYWLVPTYPDLQGAYLYYDKKSVEVIAEIIQSNLTAASQRANSSWSVGPASSCTLNEAREMQGLPRDPQGDIYRLGNVFVPVSKLMEYAEKSLTPPPAPVLPDPLQGDEDSDEKNDPDNEDNPKEDENPPQKQVSPFALPATRYTYRRQTKALDLSTTEEKQAYAASMEATRKRFEADYEKKIADYFDKERKAVVSAMKGADSSLSADEKAESAIDDQSSRLENILMDLYKDVSVDVGGQVNASLSGKKGIIADFIKLFGDSQLKYLLTLAGEKIKQISTTTLASIRLELTAGVADGESIPELAKRIDGLYLAQIIPNRSTTIARTEVVASSNYASHEAASQSGLTLKKAWLATGDSRTRPDHVNADGQEVDMNKPFSVGGSKLMYPGDNSLGASADEIINCRCTQIYKRVKSTEEDDEDASDENDNYTIDEKRTTHVHMHIDAREMEDFLVAKGGRDEYRKFMEAVL